jgi:hypothetical protein
VSVWAYFPLFLYAELPFRWLALHGHMPFTVLGKVPIMAGDLLAAMLIALYLKGRRHGDGLMATGAGLYFLNPLVLYNGAYSGGFDGLCVGLFLLALCAYTPAQPRSWAFPILYALAVAAKTYPIFILPWVLLRDPGRRLRVLIALLLVLGALSLPYLVSSPTSFIYMVALHNGHRLPSGETWQTMLRTCNPCPTHYHSPYLDKVRLFGSILLLVYGSTLFLYTGLDLLTYGAVALLLFLVFSKIVYVQYFLWPMPFLIFALLDRRSLAAGGMLALLTLVGSLDNGRVPVLRSERPITIVALALCIVAYTVYTLARASIARARGASRLTMAEEP